ncbi:MAG: methionine--tRNA ligase [Desulfovibrionaceae bacterium]
MGTFYITTPIYYVNARPHIGHAYTSIIADVLNRYHLLMGEKSFFLTGTDEHGEKIVKTASREGITPQELADTITEEYKKLWVKLDVEYSHFIRTTDKEHKDFVQDILQKVYDKGDIYFGEYGGYYCYGCERFYAEKELESGVCPQHKSKAEYITEKNYFFKMSKYVEWLKEYIANNPELIEPDQYRTEVLSLLELGELEDLCISRPKDRLTWGVELPFDSSYVCYVWFDALLNYLSGIEKREDKDELWANAHHLIAKDILKPHTVFWPCILRAAEYPIFKKICVHGYWVVRNTKMSKSIGNVIDPLLLIQEYGLDAIRYFLMREMRFGSDSNYTDELLSNRIIADLANDLGNLFSRALGMANKYVSSCVPEATEYIKDDEEIIYCVKDSIKRYQDYFENVEPSRALESLWVGIGILNKYIDTQAPWNLHKEGKIGRVQTVLYTVLESLRKISIALLPIMPSTARTMLALLGISSLECISLKYEGTSWGLLDVGNILAPSANLFPRQLWEEKMGIASGKKVQQERERDDDISKKSVSEKEICVEQTSMTNDAAMNYISLDAFMSAEVKIGIVKEVEHIAKTDTLLRLLVDVGEAKERQIVSGIAEHYSLEELINKQVVVITNLEPRTVCGVVSQGMILAAKTKDSLALIGPDKSSIAGTIVK